MEQILKNRKAFLFIVLSFIFLTNAIIAELTGVKIFSLEDTLGIEPANIGFLGGLSFNLTTGVLLWPVVFITTDLINEYFGTQGVKKISYLTTFFLLYSFLMIWIATRVSPADFWTSMHAKNGLDINTAYSRIFGQGLNIIVGSVTAFLVGQILDAYVFQYVKKYTGSRLIWLRATVSTAVSQLIDSFLVLFIAFSLLADPGTAWPPSLVLSVGVLNYLYKITVAVILIPVLYLAHYLIRRYLKEDSVQDPGSVRAPREKAEVG